MGRILSSYIFPHPPIIVPEVGRGGESGAMDTIKAAKKAAEEIKKDKPTTIIVTTPHGPVFQDFIYISPSQRLKGNLGRFGGGDVKLEFENNTALVSKIVNHARNEGILSGGLEPDLIRKYKVSTELDHGAMVPLYFIDKEYKEFKLIHISIAGLPFLELYKFGMCISRAVEESDEQVVFVASGDLSHRLTADAPYGFNESGRKFDELFISSLKRLDIERLLEVDEDFCESAGECGLRSFLMMFGAADGYELRPEVYSYEGPFGVGYSVAKIQTGDRNENRQLFKKIEGSHMQKLIEIRNNEDPYVRLARKALETYVKEGRVIEEARDLPEEMLKERAGTFVSIKKQGQLRGCIGTTEPTKKNIAQEIIQNAISSGTQDPRFDFIEEDELEKLVYSVDVLKESEPISSIDELDVIKYGIIIRSGRKSGLLLPNLEGVYTPEKQVSITLQKAGIKPDEDYSIERFEVVRHK